VKTFPPSKARKCLYPRLTRLSVAITTDSVTRHSVIVPNMIPPMVNSCAENSRWFGSTFTADSMTCARLNAMSENSPVNPAMIRTSSAFI